MTPHEASIFTAGQNAGYRVAAGVARLAAAQLLDDAHWWSRWRRRLLARGLIAYAGEMEGEADVPVPPTTPPRSATTPPRGADGSSGHAMRGRPDPRDARSPALQA